MEWTLQNLLPETRYECIVQVRSHVVNINHSVLYRYVVNTIIYRYSYVVNTIYIQVQLRSHHYLYRGTVEYSTLIIQRYNYVVNNNYTAVQVRSQY